MRKDEHGEVCLPGKAEPRFVARCVRNYQFHGQKKNVMQLEDEN